MEWGQGDYEQSCELVAVAPMIKGDLCFIVPGKVLSMSSWSRIQLVGAGKAPNVCQTCSITSSQALSVNVRICVDPESTLSWVSTTSQGLGWGTWQEEAQPDGTLALKEFSSRDTQRLLLISPQSLHISVLLLAYEGLWFLPQLDIGLNFPQLQTTGKNKTVIPLFHTRAEFGLHDLTL